MHQSVKSDIHGPHKVFDDTNYHLAAAGHGDWDFQGRAAFHKETQGETKRSIKTDYQLGVDHGVGCPRS